METTENKKKIRTFRDLQAWQASRVVVLLVYKITGKFPKNELYALTDQIRRAAISISSNIAEGFGRRSYKEKVQFYNIARGSLIEVENQAITSHDIGYVSKEELNKFMDKAEYAHRLLSGLIIKSQSFVNHS